MSVLATKSNKISEKMTNATSIFISFIFKKIFRLNIFSIKH